MTKQNAKALWLGSLLVAVFSGTALLLMSRSRAPRAPVPNPPTTTPVSEGALAPLKIRGRVIHQPSGEPVAGALVSVAGFPATITTDSEGGFLVLLTKPVSPILLQVDLLGTRIAQERVAFPDGTTEIETVVLVQLWRVVHVRTLDESTRPLGAVSLRLTLAPPDGSSPPVVLNGSTDSDGSALIVMKEALASGWSAVLAAQKTGMECVRGNGALEGLETAFRVEATMVLRSKPIASGQVTTKDGLPPSGATVTIWGIREANGAVMVLKAAGTTDAEGEFSFPAPRGGSFIVVINLDGHSTHVGPIVPGLRSSVQLSEGYVSVGHVVGEDGKPFASCRLRFRKADYPADDPVAKLSGYEYETVTDSEGVFRA